MGPLMLRHAWRYTVLKRFKFSSPVGLKGADRCYSLGCWCYSVLVGSFIASVPLWLLASRHNGLLIANPIARILARLCHPH